MHNDCSASWKLMRETLLSLSTMIWTFFLEKPCDRKPCPKAKECVNQGSGYKCVCKPGWSGDKCEKGIRRKSLYRRCIHAIIIINKN